MTNNKQNVIVTIFLALLFGLFWVPANAAPANDFWGDATLLTGASGSMAGTLVGATTQNCELNRIFPDEAPVLAKKSVWYKLLVPANGSYTFRISAGTSADTTLSAYRFTSGLCNGNIAQVPNRIVENHDYNFNLGIGDKSRISFRAFANEVIYVAVDSYLGAEGTFTLAWEKTKYRYSAQLDYNNGGADINITRTITGQYTEWWTGRYGNSNSMSLYDSILFGRWGDKRFLADYDGDGVSDFVSIRPTNGKFVWWIGNRQGNSLGAVQFGLDTDTPVAGDFDGDGIADIAVTRANADQTKTWHILRSSDGGYEAHQFGLATDSEMVGDYDGDGKTDLVAIRLNFQALQYTWYIRRSSDGAMMTREFGKGFLDVPQAADFDGDGKTDIAMFRRGANDAFTGYWFSLDSSSPLPLEDVPTRFQPFGAADDIPQAADFDGDGVTDLAIFRWETGEWWIRKSGNGQVIVYKFGWAGDIPRADTGIAAAFLDINI
jgi:hypothetical protein